MTLRGGGKDVLQAESLAFDEGGDSSLFVIGRQSIAQTRCAGRLMDVLESFLAWVKECTRSSAEGGERVTEKEAEERGKGL